MSYLTFYSDVFRLTQVKPQKGSPRDEFLFLRKDSPPKGDGPFF